MVAMTGRRLRRPRSHEAAEHDLLDERRGDDGGDDDRHDIGPVAGELADAVGVVLAGGHRVRARSHPSGSGSRSRRATPPGPNPDRSTRAAIRRRGRTGRFPTDWWRTAPRPVTARSRSIRAARRTRPPATRRRSGRRAGTSRRSTTRSAPRLLRRPPESARWGEARVVGRRSVSRQSMCWSRAGPVGGGNSVMTTGGKGRRGSSVYGAHCD